MIVIVIFAEFAMELSGLPLALEQAGAHIISELVKQPVRLWRKTFASVSDKDSREDTFSVADITGFIYFCWISSRRYNEMTTYKMLSTIF
jgi:hypothetical protein